MQTILHNTMFFPKKMFTLAAFELESSVLEVEARPLCQAASAGLQEGIFISEHRDRSPSYDH
jgi:hypothetical protein